MPSREMGAESGTISRSFSVCIPPALLGCIYKGTQMKMFNFSEWKSILRSSDGPSLFVCLVPIAPSVVTHILNLTSIRCLMQTEMCTMFHNWSTILLM